MIDDLNQYNDIDEENLLEDIINKFGKEVIIDFNQLNDTGVILFQNMIEKELSRVEDIIYRNTIDNLTEDEDIRFDSHNITLANAMYIIDYVVYGSLLKTYFNDLLLFEHSDESVRKFIKDTKITLDPILIGFYQMHLIKSMINREIDHIREVIQSMKIDKEELSEDENEIIETSNNFVSFISNISDNIRL